MMEKLSTPQDFEQLVRVHGPVLRRALLSLTGGRAEEADELLQRTLICAWRKRESYQGPAILPWLRGIARQEFRVYLRSLGRRDRLGQALASTPDLDEEPLEAPDQLKDCLGRLEALDLRIVSRYYGLAGGRESYEKPSSDAEIAAQFSQDGETWAASRVKMRRHRALIQLRQCLDRKSEGLPPGAKGTR